jgi:nitrite reductase/ring-hydroxylating ferredoxin subunit
VELRKCADSRVKETRGHAKGGEMGFVLAAKGGDVPPGTIRELQVDGKAIALANVGGQFYAINGICLHRGGPLGDGPLEGKIVTCPWHGWQYDVTTGKVAQNPSVGVDCYPVEARGEEIFVNVGEKK